MHILPYIYGNLILVVLILNIRYVIFGLHTIWWEYKINEIYFKIITIYYY